MEGKSYDGFSSFIQQMLIDLLLCAGALRAIELWEVERTLASTEILIFYGIWMRVNRTTQCVVKALLWHSKRRGSLFWLRSDQGCRYGGYRDVLVGPQGGRHCGRKKGKRRIPSRSHRDRKMLFMFRLCLPFPPWLHGRGENGLRR